MLNYSSASYSEANIFCAHWCIMPFFMVFSLWWMLQYYLPAATWCSGWLVLIWRSSRCSLLKRGCITLPLGSNCPGMPIFCYLASNTNVAYYHDLMCIFWILTYIFYSLSAASIRLYGLKFSGTQWVGCHLKLFSLRSLMAFGELKDQKVGKAVIMNMK